MMKSFTLLLSAVLIVGITSCKVKSKSQTSSSASDTSKDDKSSTVTTTNQQTVYEGVTDKECAVEMAFGSYSAGIDGAALDKVIALLDSKKIKYTSKNIGREGERRLCMPLTELKEKEKKDLIEQLKKIATAGQLVSLSIR